jgi:hypothetical protein
LNDYPDAVILSLVNKRKRLRFFEYLAKAVASPDSVEAQSFGPFTGFPLTATCYWPNWRHVRQAKLGASCRENDPVGQGKSTARTEC